MRARPTVLLLIVGLSVVARAQDAEPLEVVYRRDVGPYRTVLEGLREKLPGAVSAHDLSAPYTPPPQLEGSGPPVTAVGRSALETVLLVRPAGRTAAFAMVNNPWPLLEGQSGIEGLSMNVEPAAQLRELLRFAPQVRRVGLIYDPDQSGGAVRWFRDAAQDRGVTLVTGEARSAGAAVARLADLADEVDALWLVPDTTVITPPFMELALTLSFERRMPVLAFSGRYVESGALLSLDLVPAKVGGQLAELVRRGVGAGAARVHPVRDYQLVINADTARRLGLEIPAGMRRRARVLESDR